MSVLCGPDVVTDGLVMHLDAANLKSFRGEPTVNVANTTYLAVRYDWTNSGTKTTNDNDTSVSKPTILGFNTTPYRIISSVTTATGSLHVGCAKATVSPSTTYTISVYFMQNRAGSNQPYFRQVVNDNGKGNFYYNGSSNAATWPINTWIRITATATTSANENGVFLSNYIGTAVGDKVWYFGQQVEQKAYATPLVAGTRGKTVASGGGWADLSGNDSNSELVNYPTYSSDSGGSVVFSGVDDYANVFVSGLTTTASIEMFCKPTSFSSTMFFGWNTYDIYCTGGAIGYNTANSDQYGISSATVTSLGLLNNWKQYVFEMRSDVSYVNNKLYINGEAQSLSQILGTEAAGSRNFNSGVGRIATWIANPYFFMPMNCSIVRIYNRSLSQSEITQNYRALKGRFGM